LVGSPITFEAEPLFESPTFSSTIQPAIFSLHPEDLKRTDADGKGERNATGKQPSGDYVTSTRLLSK
jgi:hypothetical protein